MVIKTPFIMLAVFLRCFYKSFKAIGLIEQLFHFSQPFLSDELMPKELIS